MADWYWSKEDFIENTPSRKDGISQETEKRYRKDGVTLIILCSTSLGLHHDTMATGAVFFHRFFMLQSFKHFHRWVMAASCLLLAGKVEETPKKCKDILKTVKAHLTEEQWAKFGSDPKDELLTHEKILLQTIMFDLVVENPYAHMLTFSKTLMELATKAKKKDEKLEVKQEKLQKLVQLAWTFINDSLCTTLPLHWEPQAIAVAFLYRAAKMSDISIQSLCGTRRSWWRQFADTVDEHDLEKISAELTDLYNQQDDKGAKGEPSKGSEGNSQLGSSESSPLPVSSHHHTMTGGGGAGEGTGGGGMEGSKLSQEQRSSYHKSSSTDSTHSLSQGTVSSLAMTQAHQQNPQNLQNVSASSTLASTAVTSVNVTSQPPNAYEIAARQKAQQQQKQQQQQQQQATLASMYQFRAPGTLGIPPPNLFPVPLPTSATQMTAYANSLGTQMGNQQMGMGIPTTTQSTMGHPGNSSYLNFTIPPPPLPPGTMGMPTPPPIPPSDMAQQMGMLHHQLSQGNMFHPNSGNSGNSSSFLPTYSSNYRHN